MVTRDDHYHAVKVAVDTVSAVFTLGALLNWLPAIAAGVVDHLVLHPYL